MIYVDMAASELGFELLYSNSGVYFVLVDYQRRIVRLFDDNERSLNDAINWMYEERGRKE